MDVSFNGASAKRRDELNESKALLIKSFALQGKERSIKTKNEEKAKEEQLGAASKAKQKVRNKIRYYFQVKMETRFFHGLISSFLKQFEENICY